MVAAEEEAVEAADSEVVTVEVAVEVVALEEAVEVVAVDEAVVSAVAEAAEVVAVMAAMDNPTSPQDLETGPVLWLTAATKILPGETNVTNVNKPNLKVPAVMMEVAEVVVALAVAEEAVEADSEVVTVEAAVEAVASEVVIVTVVVVEVASAAAEVVEDLEEAEVVTVEVAPCAEAVVVEIDIALINPIFL